MNVSREVYQKALHDNPHWIDKPIEDFEISVMQHIDIKTPQSLMAYSVYKKGQPPRYVLNTDLTNDKQGT